MIDELDAKYDGIWRDLSDSEVREFRQWAHDNWQPGQTAEPMWHPVSRSEWNILERLYSLGLRAVEMLMGNNPDPDGSFLIGIVNGYHGFTHNLFDDVTQAAAYQMGLDLAAELRAARNLP